MMAVVLRLLGLTIALNIVRYTIVGFVEQPVAARMFGVMGTSPNVFNTTFGIQDWVMSFAYNFVLWLTVVVAFHFMQPALRGSWLLRSLQGWGMMWLAFASTSAVYMNHYRVGRAFYAWSILDAALAFGVLAVANAVLYPRFVATAARRQVAV